MASTLISYADLMSLFIISSLYCRVLFMLFSFLERSIEVLFLEKFTSDSEFFWP